MSTCVLFPKVSSLRLGDLVDAVGDQQFAAPHRVAAIVPAPPGRILTLIDTASGATVTVEARLDDEMALTPPF